LADDEVQDGDQRAANQECKAVPQARRRTQYGRARRRASLLSLPESSARGLGIIFRFDQLGRRVSGRPAAAVEQDRSR